MNIWLDHSRNQLYETIIVQTFNASLKENTYGKEKNDSRFYADEKQGRQNYVSDRL